MFDKLVICDFMWDFLCEWYIIDMVINDLIRGFYMFVLFNIKRLLGDIFDNGFIYTNK